MTVPQLRAAIARLESGIRARRIEDADAKRQLRDLRHRLAMLTDPGYAKACESARQIPALAKFIP